MRHEDDYQLLRLYAERGSQEAFSKLVQRYLGLVYSVCLRETRNPTLAEDATQAVFLALAQKAGSLKGNVVLAGWLFNAGRYAARNALRGETRRAVNEAKAVEEMAREFHEAEEQAWERVEPCIGDALARLKTKEREAVLLRFFQEKSYKEVGAVLGIPEANARMRVMRAIEKLRGHLAKAGVAVSAMALGELMAGRAAHAVPASCSAKMSLMISGLASGASAFPNAGAYQLSRGVLRAMFVSKVKVAAVTAGLVCLCVLGGRKAIRLASADDAASIGGAAPAGQGDQSTPENTLTSFSQALGRDDMVAAAKYVWGGRSAAELAGLQKEADKDPDIFEIAGITAKISGDDSEADVQEFNNGPVDKSGPLMSYGSQQVPLRRQDGQWFIVPASSESLQKLNLRPESRLLVVATLLASPDTLKALQGTAFVTACLNQLEVIGHASRRMSVDNNGTYNMDATNYVARMAPYLPKSGVWKCPSDKTEDVSYTFNSRLANVDTKSIVDPAHTVLFYEGHNGKLDLRHENLAGVAFVDGTVKAVSLDEANQLKLTPG